MKCMLVMDDWRKSGVAGSVYNTELGLSLSTGDMHSGSTFNATVELPPEITAEIMDAWIARRAYPVFCLIPGVKHMKCADCECQHWARVFDPKHMTTHHPECSHYNDSLIDVWHIEFGGRVLVCDTEPDPEEYEGRVTKLKMHREVYEHMPEFEGF